MAGRNSYWIGAAVAIFAGLLQVWINLAAGIVGNEENPANLGFYMVVLGAMACAFTAGFRAPGMARAMVATAGVQAMLGVVVATAPVNAAESLKVLMLSGGFASLWLFAAAMFHRAGQGGDAERAVTA